MNARKIWALWHDRKNTAQIAEKLKLKECEVDSIIARCMNEQYLKREKPFNKEGRA